MSVIALLKFFHYLGLFFAGGLGVAGGVLQACHRRAGQMPSPPVQNTLRILAWLSLAAIAILWVTGVGLTHLIYGHFALGLAFYAKLFGASGLLFILLFLNVHLSAAAKAQKPPVEKWMKLIPPLSRGALVIVLAGIAIMTSYGPV